MREYKMEAAEEEEEEDNKNKSPPLDGCKKFPENCFFNRLPAKIPIPRRRRDASTTSNNRQRPFRTLVIDRCDVGMNPTLNNIPLLRYHRMVSQQQQQQLHQPRQEHLSLRMCVRESLLLSGGSCCG